MRCYSRLKWPSAVVLFTISLAISGCSGGNAPPAGILNSPAAQAAGAKLFAAHCAICHGAKGDGYGLRGEFMIPPPSNLSLPPWSDAAHAAKTYAIIRNGVRETAMPSWPSLSERQIWDLVAFITSLKSH